MFNWLCFALESALLARVIGDSRLAGFFDRIRGTKFASLDSVLFSPLCLLLAARVFHLANADGA
jgi:hypothetical protein